MRRRSILLLLVLSCFCNLLAQKVPVYVDHLKKTDYVLMAELQGIPYRIKINDSTYATFQGRHPNGIPRYVAGTNAEAAEITGVNKFHLLYPSINGEYMMAGVWDENSVRESHVEHVNKLSLREDFYFANWHGTHVAGTFAARGIDKNARGMAPAAHVLSYNWVNDESEMMHAALNDSLRVSNHSYANLTGWYHYPPFQRWTWWGDTTVSGFEDYKYGFYDAQAQIWDDIAWHHPHYLIVKAAGNDRSRNIDSAALGLHLVYDGFLDKWIESSTVRKRNGDYDCISGSGNSKNVLTVGSIDKLEVTGGINNAGYSSWGPTDDGRIKPDIMGVGSRVYSSTAENDNAYGVIWGTSMAAPNVAGTVLLLQQLHKSLYGEFMNAYLAKAVILHAAMDAGKAGPDYSFGYGILDAVKSAELVNHKNSMLFDTLVMFNDSVVMYFYSDADTFKTTICWTDPPGEVHAPALNKRDSKLINDLDITVSKMSAGSLHFPFLLDPANPYAPAATGINKVDNAEQVIVSNPSNELELYRVVIHYKSSRYNVPVQHFALVVNDVTEVADLKITPSKVTTSTSVLFNPDLPLTEPAGTEYSWEIGGQVSSQKTPVFSFDTLGLHTVNFKLRLPGSGQLLQALTKQITVLNDTSVNVYRGQITQSDIDICLLAEYKLKSTFKPVDSIPVFIEYWFEGASPSYDTGLSQATEFIFTTPGNYSVKIRAVYGSGYVNHFEFKNTIRVHRIEKPDVSNIQDSMCSPIDPAYFEVYPYQQVDIFYNNTLIKEPFYLTGPQQILLKFKLKYPALCAEDDSVSILMRTTPPKPSIYKLGDSLKASPPGYPAFWFLNDVFLRAGPSVLPVKSGNYRVKIRNGSDGCETWSSYFNHNMASVPDLKAKAFSIYPNPTSGGFTVFNSEKNSILEKLEVYNVYGQLLHSEKITEQQDEFYCLALLSPGLYFIRLKISGTWFSERLLVD